MARKLDRHIFGEMEHFPSLKASGCDWIEAIDKIEERPRLAVSLLLCEILRYSRMFAGDGYLGEFLPRFSRETQEAYRARTTAFDYQLLHVLAEIIPIKKNDRFDRYEVSEMDIEMLLNVYAKVCDSIPYHAQPRLVTGRGGDVAVDAVVGDKRGKVTRLASRIVDIVGPFDIPVAPAAVVRAAAEVVSVYLDEMEAGRIPMSPERAAKIERTAIEIDRRARMTTAPGPETTMDLEALRVAVRTLSSKSGYSFGGDYGSNNITDCAPPPENEIEEVLAEYSKWKATAPERHAEALAAMKATILEDEHAYDDFLGEAMSEFKTYLLNRALPEYGQEWVDGFRQVDKWVFENVESRGLEAKLLALVSYRGLYATEDSIQTIATVFPSAKLANSASM